MTAPTTASTSYPLVGVATLRDYRALADSAAGRPCIVKGMDAVAAATWGLVLATVALVATAAVQYRDGRQRAAESAEREERSLRVLSEQAAALAASAKANQAVAEEMFAARKAANPLTLTLKKGELTPGTFQYQILNVGERPVILLATELLRGQGSDVEWTTVQRDNWGNIYLAPSGDGHYVNYVYGEGGGDLLRFVVAGRP